MTSAIATANFLSSQTPNGTAYVVGDSGLMNALYTAGYLSYRYVFG
jgi:NagD protein